jgi:hypothetical protein
MSILVRDEDRYPSIDPDDVSIGMKVRVVFHDVTDEITLPVRPRLSGDGRAPGTNSTREGGDGQWSDWYAEDPTQWVLAEILEARDRAPDVTISSSPTPLGQLRRVNARPTRWPTPSSPRRAARRVGQRDAAQLREFLPVWYGILKAGR